MYYSNSGNLLVQDNGIPFWGMNRQVLAALVAVNCVVTQPEFVKESCCVEPLVINLGVDYEILLFVCMFHVVKDFCFGSLLRERYPKCYNSLQIFSWYGSVLKIVTLTKNCICSLS